MQRLFRTGVNFKLICGPFAALVFLAGVSSATASSLNHFRPLEKDKLPRGFLQHLCSGSGGAKECLDDFRRQGVVWAGDVNDDGVDEYIVDDGGMPGTLGPARFLVQQKGAHWRSLACLGPPEEREGDCESRWNTLRARFDILPVLRQGYHDLRIEVDRCLKWDGNHYVDYGVDDYAKLRMDWFDSSDSHEAEFFWKIRYGERNVLQFEPLWFSISREEFDRPPQPYMGFPIRIVEFPKLPYVACADPDYDLRWLSFFKGGVWGVRGDRAFLLVPQPSYLGAPLLELSGDWLLIYGEVEEPQGTPTIRYNRRTHELRFEIEQ